MICLYCNKQATNNFIRVKAKTFHFGCLAKMHNAARLRKVESATFKECGECQANCHPNYLTYKGYWYHENCLVNRLTRNVGSVRAYELMKEISKD